MPYFIISNFSGGIDRRRLIDTGASSSLWECRNAFITDGGQIEKRLAFTPVPYVTAALRVAPSNAIMTRGMIPTHIIIWGQINRVAVRAGAAWPADGGTSATPYLFGGLRIHWLDPVYATGNYVGYPWFSISVAYQAETVGGAGFLGFDSANQPCFFEHNMTYNITAAGPGAPGTADGEWYGKAGTVSESPRILPRFKMAHKTKIFAVNGIRLESGNASGVGSGAGSTLVLDQEGFVGAPMAMATYYTQLVVFGNYGAQFWSMDVDFAQSQFLRGIENLPLAGPRSVCSYGAGDVMFLAADGVRSMTARDSSNFARSADVGSPIDNLVNAVPPDVAYLAIGTVYTRLGHFWMILGDSIYVLSRHPSAKILAWSRYDLPESDGGGTQDFTAHPDDSDFGLSSRAIGPYVADAMPAGLSVAFRTFEDQFFVYGGADGMAYDDSPAVVQTHYLDFDRPSHVKQFSGIDVACLGTWLIEASVRPYDEEWEEVAVVTNSTFGEAKIPYQNASEHLSIRATCTDASRAVLASIAVHYELGDQG